MTLAPVTQLTLEPEYGVGVTLGFRQSIFFRRGGAPQQKVFSTLKALLHKG
jgi:hypothetical protein